MASHEAWLGAFVVQGLDEYLRFVQTGQPMVEYGYKVESGIVNIWRRDAFVRSLCTIETPQAPQTTRVQVTDGRHCLPAVFWRVAEEGLERIGVEQAHLTGSTVNLQVTRPIISIDCSYPHETLELRLEIEKCEPIQNDSAKAIRQVERQPLGTLPSVKQKMLEFTTQWSAQSRNIGTPKGSPSGSIRSQARSSLGNASDADDDISQVPFQSQINVVTCGQKSSMPSPTVNHEETLRTASTLIGRANALAQTISKETRLSPVQQTNPVTAQNEEDVTPHVSIKPVLRDLTRHGPAAEVALNEVVDGEQGLHSRESVQDECGANHFESAKRSDQIGGTARYPDPTRSAGSKQESSQLPTSLIRHFRRWREEAQSGRYIPRYLQKIPRDQEALLESDDSWQPALVGRTVMPGQIPIHLNERFMKFAEQKDSLVEEQLPTNEPIPELEKPITPEIKRTLHERYLDNAASDLEDSVASWSPSPPTQDRRRQALPADSPLPSARQRRNSTLKSAAIKAEAPPRTRSVTSKCGGDNQPLLSSSSSPVDEHPMVQPDSLVTNRNLSREEQVAHRVPDPSRNGTSVSETTAADALKSSIQPVVEKSVAGSKKASSPQEKLVQVERTPYIPKRPLTRVVKTAFKGTDNTHDSGLASSGCIPCSYDERSCALLPAMQADAGVPLIGSCTIPRTDTLQSKYAGAIGSANEYSHSLSTGGMQQRESIPPTNKTNDENGPGVNADKQAGISSENADSVRLASSSERSRRPGSTTSQGDQRLEAEQKTVRSRSETAETVPASQILLNSLTSHEHSAEASGGAASAMTGQPRDISDVVANIPVPHYVSELRDHRRTALKAISKQPLQSRKSSSSARDTTSSDGNDQYGIAGDGSPILQTEAPSPQLSTPNNQFSTYGRAEGYLKMQPSDSISHAATPLVIDLQPVFRRYQNAYADYRGDFTAFETACRLLGKFWRLGKELHSYLYDDAIYHHHHGFRWYLLHEGPDEDTRIMTFYEYYLQRVVKPTHTKRVVTKAVVENLPGPRPLELFRQMEPPLRTSDAATSPFPNANESISILPAPTMLSDVPIGKGHTGHYASQPGSAVEQWRREISRLPSPELGTPGVDRGQVDVVSSPEITNSEIGHGLPAVQESNSSVRQAASVLPLQKSREMEVSKKRKRSPTLRNVIPNSLEAEVSVTPKRAKGSKPSANPFVKPSRPASATASTVKMTPTQRAQRWWVDSDTPFKRFERHYSSLTRETLTGNKGNHTTTYQPGYVKKIEIFSWRP
ncbi:hypothetical protein PV08_01334 [Exophiala spinifera]|uniref:Telomere replication protein EST3 n=1 Tax=Exophiala spinifera TaxID=91928 RepID=A0A0D1YZK7_9EURO|nr:uncharacterized protein PV08_01334 [Exophiala spinifera]KIW20756.1 hypothetical protein PV08_01334 [Exophiala spinifera]